MAKTDFKKDLDRLLGGLSTNPVKFLRAEGYPLRMIGNGGHEARLVGMKPLSAGKHAGIYRYPGGDAVHDLNSISRSKRFAVLEA